MTKSRQSNEEVNVEQNEKSKASADVGKEDEWGGKGKKSDFKIKTHLNLKNVLTEIVHNSFLVLNSEVYNVSNRI